MRTTKPYSIIINTDHIFDPLTVTYVARHAHIQFGQLSSTHNGRQINREILCHWRGGLLTTKMLHAIEQAVHYLLVVRPGMQHPCTPLTCNPNHRHRVRKYIRRHGRVWGSTKDYASCLCSVVLRWDFGSVESGVAFCLMKQRYLEDAPLHVPNASVDMLRDAVWATEHYL